MDFKNLNIRDGVVMGHQFEVAELVQEYMNDNVQSLIEALFATQGVLAPDGAELQPTIAPTDKEGVLRLAVSPGFAICNAGLIRVSSTIAKEFRRDVFLQEGIIREPNGEETSLTVDQPFLNLRYAETTDTPVELVPYGNGDVDLRVKPSYELTIDDTKVDISEGVPLAKINPSERSITDLRSQNAASLRADRSLLYDLVDPALVEDVETLFSRDNFVNDIENLLDEKQLQGEYVVTRLKDAVDPFFVRASYEPELRAILRDLNGIQADREIEPAPQFRTVVEWNIYGVTATKVSSKTFELDTQYDLTNIDYDGYDKPLYLRFQNNLYPVSSIVSPKRVELETDINVGTKSSVDTSKDEAMSAGASDPNAALTNGADKFTISAEPGLTWHRKGKNKTDTAIDSGAREPMGEMKLEPGVWRTTIESSGDNSRAVSNINLEVPELDAPSQPSEVSLTGEQREPANTGDDPIELYEDGDGGGGGGGGEVGGAVRTHAANPFNNLETDENGQALLNTGEIDKYIDEVEDELRRIQAQEVALDLRIVPGEQTRNTARQAMTIGYDVKIEMLTGEGWKEQKSMKVMRPTDELMKEVTWRDLVSDRYRGAVNELSDLTQLSFHMGRLDVQTDSGRPIRENDIVYVENDADASKNGYWRYEPKMREDTSQGLTNSDGESILTYPYGDSAGYWVQVDVNRGSYRGDPINIDIPGMSGGADYRAHVKPIAEDGQSGPKVTDHTDELRSKYNAELGRDFHKEIGDIYSQYKKILGQVSPERFNEYLDEKVEEVRSIIDRAAQYGTPPKVSGPFEVAPQPGAVRFSGQNLGKVQRINMRFAPPGKTEEQQVRQKARFKFITGSGSPQIAISNLPDLADISNKVPPVVTLQFDAGAAGSDIFVVRYQKEQPTITGPSVPTFKEERVVDINKEVKYGNTASFWRFDYNYYGEPRAFGPLPKRWPYDSSYEERTDVFREGWEVYDRIPNLRHNIITENSETYVPDYNSSIDYEYNSFVEYEGQIYRATADINAGANVPSNNADWSSHNLPTTERRVVEEEVTARALSFNASNMKPDNIIDIRVREMPSGQLVPQTADENWERWRQYTNKAHYFSLFYENNSIKINVPTGSMNMWVDKNFELEVIYYGSALNGTLEDGKGYVLTDRGEQDSRPPNPEPGHFYADTSDGNVYLYTHNRNWSEAEDIESTKHTFTVKRDDSEEVEDRKETKTRIWACNEFDDYPISEDKTGEHIISYHTPSKSGARVQPITENFRVQEDLEASARVTAKADDRTSEGREMVVDEWRIDKHDLNDSNSRVRDDGFKAIEVSRTKSSFGQDTVKGLEKIPDVTTGHAKLKVCYKPKQTYSGSIARYESNNTGQVDRAVVTVNSTDYLVDYNSDITKPAGSSIEIDGVITTYNKTWGGSTYEVIRAVDIRYPEDAADNLYADGPDSARLDRSDGSLSLTFETTDSADSLSASFASGSSTLTKTESTYTNNGKLLLDVDLDWQDFFQNTRPRLYERPDAQGRTRADVPSYRRTDVYDFRRQSLRVESVRLKITASRNGNEEYHYCSIQVTQDG
jgi:hypothetical protein